MEMDPHSAPDAGPTEPSTLIRGGRMVVGGSVVEQDLLIIQTMLLRSQADFSVPMRKQIAWSTFDDASQQIGME